MFVSIPAWTLMIALLPVAAASLPDARVSWLEVLYWAYMLMYLSPKLAGYMHIRGQRMTAALRGLAQFVAGVVCELIFSLLQFAVTSLHVTGFIAAMMLGRSARWSGQGRCATRADGVLARSDASLWPQTPFGIVLHRALLAIAPAALPWALPVHPGVHLVAIPFRGRDDQGLGRPRRAGAIYAAGCARSRRSAPSAGTGRAGVRHTVNERVRYLEGLRGVSAVQVVLLHFFTAFLPGAVDHAWPPLRVAFDGHTAVYVFFLISGAVLTGSFARGGAWPGQVLKRLLRLGVPVAAAAVFALMLVAALPQAHRQAAVVSGSAWLAMDSSGAPTVSHLVREIGLDSLVLGYREYTLFAPLAGYLPTLDHSLDAPFWSLHLELYGSFLVLGLVWMQARSVWLHRAAVVCLRCRIRHPPDVPVRAGSSRRHIGYSARAVLLRRGGAGSLRDWR